jgi:thiol-disulfide isomerase/thioredoxin
MKVRNILAVLISCMIFASYGFGEKVDIYDFQSFKKFLNKNNDTTYFIHFWATWCIPCLKELPEFNKFAEDYADHKVSVILVSLDFPNQVDSRLIPFLRKNNITGRVIVLDDPNQNYWINKVSPEWTGAIPATLIYNKNYSEFYEKSLTYEELVSNIRKE